MYMYSVYNIYVYMHTYVHINSKQQLKNFLNLQ
jgi:hypothetical protein